MKKICVLGAAVIMLAACVTINIYFPAAAVEKAADRIIDEIMQQKKGAEPVPAVQPGEKK